MSTDNVDDSDKVRVYVVAVRNRKGWFLCLPDGQIGTTACFDDFSSAEKFVKEKRISHEENPKIILEVRVIEAKFLNPPWQDEVA